MKNIALGFALSVYFAALVIAAPAVPPGTATSMVVTLEPKQGKEISPVEAADLTVLQGKERVKVHDFTPAGQNGKGMQLLLLIDDSAGGSFNSQLPVLKQFVTALPASTEIAIGYMRNGTNQMASDFTRDHQTAANSLRLALGAGGSNVSPYDSLSDAIKNWQAGAERREVIMIGSGIEGLGGGYAPDNPYVNRGIADAQRAGVVVYTIYNPGYGHAGHSLWRGTWGQNFLSQLADETGGESYMIGFGPPVSFQPFLDQITEQMQHQFVLTFEAKAEKKAGLQPVSVNVTEKNASVTAAGKVFVKAGM